MRQETAPSFPPDSRWTLPPYDNSYNQLQTEEPGAPFLEVTPVPPHLVLPVVAENLMYGETHGVEISAKWKWTCV